MGSRGSSSGRNANPNRYNELYPDSSNGVFGFNGFQVGDKEYMITGRDGDYRLVNTHESKGRTVTDSVIANGNKQVINKAIDELLR